MSSRARRALLTAGWAGAAILTLVAPGNLVMRLAFGKLDDPALGRQVLFTALGLALAMVTFAYGRRTGDPGDGPARWAVVVTWVAAGVPVLGFSAPHLLWGLGLPLGVGAGSRDGLGSLGGSAVYWALLVAGPVAGAVLTLGLISGWGRIVPAWVPVAGGRRVPRALAVLPPVVVGLLVGQYGTMMTGCLAFGITRTCAPGGNNEALDGSWGFMATYPVFLLWGVSLLAAAVGRLGVTGPRVRVT
ncbi:hypothetical protein OIE66_24055 [Nonomuraea sp. NBC_01738]|uniref:hypothetical protein n=1 Tax=Nonomuraea sp. NBC_01738 TaxID=2976003 RepID=UPI002E0DA5CC|nr:hypothetical protein OIE66_24055 [Nonomuraea sp. NBC_01738]